MWGRYIEGVFAAAAAAAAAACCSILLLQREQYHLLYCCGSTYSICAAISVVVVAAAAAVCGVSAVQTAISIHNSIKQLQEAVAAFAAAHSSEEKLRLAVPVVSRLIRKILRDVTFFR